MINLKNPVVKKSEEQEFIDNLFLKHFRFPPELTIDIFADNNRILSTKESALDGKWKTARTPYLREPMQCLSPSHPCQTVVVMGATQVGKTEIMVNGDSFSIVEDPCAFMNVFPNGALFADFSIQRLKSMINNTPCVREKMAPEKSRDSSNTIGRKEFDNGILFLVTGASEISMISRPLKKVFIDEVDQMEPWVISMADDRMRTYKPYNKLYLVSTPKKKESSIINIKFMEGDQRHYYIACPSCGEYQILIWDNFKFERDEHYNLDSEVSYACKECGDHISEYKMKDDMDSRAEWRPHNKENGQYPSFHLPQYYSTLGDASWESAVKKFLEFTKLEDKKNLMYLELKEAWTNSVLAIPWEEPDVGNVTAWEVLYNRREDCANDIIHAIINEKILILCAGIDVHGNRIEIQVIGFGLNYEQWVIEYKHIYGNIADLAVQAHLDQFLLKTYKHPRGNMRILSVAVDTGYRPDEVYDFVRTRYIPDKRYVFGIKGSSQLNQPIVATQSKQKDTNLFGIDTNTTKDKLSSFLKVTEPGPGYVHFPLSLPEVYFQQLCAEKKTNKWNEKSRKYMDVWRNPDKARNEALDTYVYAIAALNILRFLAHPAGDVPQMLEFLAKQMNGTAAAPNRGRMISEGVEI